MTRHVHVQELIQQNIAENMALTAATGGHVQCCPFTWGKSTLQDLPQAWQQADLIIAADVRPSWVLSSCDSQQISLI